MGNNEPWVIIGIFTGIIVFMVWLAVMEGREWKQFSQDHNCKVTQEGGWGCGVE